MIARVAGGRPALVRMPSSGAFPLAASGACATVALLTVVMPRAALSLVIVLLIVALWLIRPDLGVVALWTTWLLIAGARRVLDLALPVEGYDPLSIVPFAATAAVAALELLKRRLPPRPQRIMILAALGLAIGVPAGAWNPPALTFALFAYGAGILAFGIGYAEGLRTERSTSGSRCVAALLAPLALYGLAQYVLALPAWDEQWVREAQLTSIAVPGDIEHVRVFSALNSPATFGSVLAVGLVAVLARDRITPGAAIAAALALVALGLTYVRMAIPALAIGLIVYAAASRWRALPRVAGFAAAVVAASLALGATTQAGGLVLERVSTLGSLSADRSANERQTTFWQVVPEAALSPLGHGVGTAGEPSKLAPEAAFGAAVDNGYLGLLYQLGPVGFLLVLAAMAAAVGSLIRARAPTPGLQRARQLDLAIVATLFVLAVATDVFYGILGALLWFHLGHGLALADRSGAPPAARRPGIRETLRSGRDAGRYD